MKGKRHVITFITGSENDPRVLGLTPVDAFATSFPVRQDDDDNVDIPADELLEVAGQQIPERQIVVRPNPDDEVNVNGTCLDFLYQNQKSSSFSCEH